jgi:LruC domain-containing protein
LAFEDLWPATGDYDFNDLVCDYQFKVVTNAVNHVVEVFAMFSLKAIGGSFHNGFGFQLNPDITNYALINVTGTVLTSNYIQLQGNGLESGQNLPTFIVFDDAWDLVSPVSGFTGFNTVQGAPWSAPYNTQLQITFTNEQLSLVDLNLASFNPFIIVNEVRGREVHLPDYEPSSKANPSLFGQQADNSIPVMHRYYKTQNNLPWAINIPTPFDYSIEKCDITQAHLKMINWVESGGSTFQDWYLNLDGYRNQDNIFQH